MGSNISEGLKGVSRVLKRTAAAMKRQRSAARVFSEMSKGFRALTTDGSDETTTSSLTDEIASQAEACSTALSLLRGTGQDEEDRVVTAYSLALALSSLSALLIDTANSMRLGCGEESLKSKDGRPFPEILSEMRDSIGDVAYEMHLNALGIEDAIGIPGGVGGFSWPEPVENCGCGAMSPTLTEIPETSEEFIVDESRGLNRQALQRQLRHLNVVAATLAGVTADLAFFLLALPALISCVTNCQPGTWLVTYSRLTTFGAGWFQFQFDLNWRYCCENVCWIRWKESFWVTLPTTSHRMKVPVSKSQKKTLRIGKETATLFAAQLSGHPEWNYNPTFIPAIKLPTPPSCGRIWMGAF